MEISKYEAASFYDYRNSGKTDKIHYLVFDLQDCSCGHCVCNAGSQTNLIHICTESTDDLWDWCVQLIDRKLRENKHSESGLIPGIIEQLKQSRSAIYNYLTSFKQADSLLFDLDGTTISCSQFEQLIQPLTAVLQRLAERVINQTEDSLLEDISIIVLGQAQEIYLLEYLLRSVFSADPLLPDNRFRNAFFRDHYSEIIELGAALHQKLNTIRHNYALMLFDQNEQKLKDTATVAKESAPDKLAHPVFIGPVFVTAGDKLIVRIDDRLKELDLPYSFSQMDSDTVELAFGLSGKSLVLLVRSCMNRAGVYQISLDEAKND